MTANTPHNPYSLLLETARQAIEQYLAGDNLDVPALKNELNKSQGVFVTLWEKPKKLRGCIGRTQGVAPTLSQEVAECAILAATKDPRFKPIQNATELVDLWIELSLLMPLEAIAQRSQLDPARYGVVVAKGDRQGLLLPNVDGVHTVAEQLNIALRKGNIDRDEEYEMWRFEVLKLSESTR